MAHRRLGRATRRRVGIVLLIALVVCAFATPAAALPADPQAAAPGGYLSPVAAGVVIDHFRPPAGPYAAGNRGVDERTPAGSLVRASAAGRVVFAGQVAGSLHVTVLHADGLRTTYSFLASVLVRNGDEVVRGATLGLTGTFAHFGVRDPQGTYLDPEALWEGRAGAHLVAGPDEGAPALGPTDSEAVLLARALAGAPGRRGGGVVALAYEAAASTAPAALDAFTREAMVWARSRDRCTPAGQPVAPPTTRRIAILVGGLGSSSAAAAVDGVDTPSLGYQPADVVRFSYRGGRVPDGRGDHGALADLATTEYRPGDTAGGLDDAAARLADLISTVGQLMPGTPVDLIAHSQGGVVARLALRRLAPAPLAAPAAGPAVDTLVTLGTPHQGAELATALAALGPRSGSGGLVDRLVDREVGISADAPAIADLSQTSDVVARLAEPVPSATRVLSIGASGDLTVPAVRTSVPGATNVVVHLGGLHAHDQLPSSPAVTREVALALAGAAPNCTTLAQAASDLVASHAIAQSETLVGLGAAGLLGP